MKWNSTCSWLARPPELLETVCLAVTVTWGTERARQIGEIHLAAVELGHVVRHLGALSAWSLGV